MIRRGEQDADMTPMVDVTFLILIFFMVTASFSLQRAIEHPIERSDLASTRSVNAELEKETIRLQVDRHGGFLLMASNWQRESVGKRNLINDLTEVWQNTRNEVELQIQVEPEAKLQTLVDAIDAASIVGFKKYQLTEISSEFI